jgi:hypothetical protein
MKIKRPFVKVVLLMKLLNIFYSNQTLILEDCSIHLKIFNIHVIQNTIFHDSHAIKMTLHRQM